MTRKAEHNSGMRLADIEARLRERLGGALPGVDAHLRFVPVPTVRGWRAGEFPVGTRDAAALLCLYPGDSGIAIPLTLRASTLARHAGQISLPGGATDPGETPAGPRFVKHPRRLASIPRRCACSASSPRSTCS
jgi:hypothetical protein